MFPFAAARKATGTVGAPRANTDHDLIARAPGLREASERIVVSVVKGLQTMAGAATTVEGMLAGFGLEKARDIVAAHRPFMAAGSIILTEHGQTLLATLDATLVHAMVEILCGGNGVEAPSVEPRPVTSIDQQFAHIVFTLVASGIQTEWAAMGFGPARAMKIEGPLTSDLLGSRNDDIGVVNITIGIFGLHGTLQLALPRAALDRFGASTTEASSVSHGLDSDWARHLQQEVGRAPVALAAYLDAKDIPLSSIAGLKIGQILALPHDARSRATLISDGRVLYRGEIGQEDSRFSLRIDEVVAEPGSVARMASLRSSYLEVSKAQ